VSAASPWAAWPALRRWAVPATLLALVVAISLATPSFWSGENLLNITRQMSINAIIAAGMTLVILTGGIDLSVGSVLAFVGIVTALMLKSGVGVAVGVLAGALVGGALGTLNGLLIAFGRLPPFVVTLAMMAVARSLTRVVTQNKSLYHLPEGLSLLSETLDVSLARVHVLLPVPFLLTALVYGLGYVLLVHYPLGRYIYAVGGNEEAARLAGVPVRRVKIIVYASCGALAGFAGVLAISRLAAADPTSGVMMELDAIAAVVIGGGSLTGGRGHIFGTIVGVVIIAVLHNVMTLLDVNPDWQGSVLGAVVLVAVLAGKRKGEAAR
jgi:ribose transport system permease protein